MSGWNQPEGLARKICDTNSIGRICICTWAYGILFNVSVSSRWNVNPFKKANNIYRPTMETEGRGFVNETNGQVEEICSLAYLHILYLELSRARAFVLVSIEGKPDIRRQEERLDFLAYEFDRLFQHPALYPSPAVKARFLMLCFHHDSEYNFLKSCKDLLVNKELMNVQEGSNKHLVQPTYMQGSSGWENFLLPGAPGAPVSNKHTEPVSAFQILTGIGMRICSDFQREENDIIQCVQSIAGHGIKTLKTLPLILNRVNWLVSNKQKQTWPAASLRYHTENVVLSPSPFRKDLAIRLDVRSTSSSPLEHYSQMLYRAEQQGPDPNAPAAALNAPNVFPIMGIRSWHSPLRRWDLHYHTEPREKCECQRKRL